MTTNEQPLIPMLADIARRHLGVPSLETCNSDSLNFYDVAARNIQAALAAAFEAGQKTRGAPQC